MGQRVKLVRKRLGLTQDQLAEASGLRQSDVSKIELGLILQTTAIARLASALGVRPAWLELGEEPEVGQSASHRPSRVATQLLNWEDVRTMADEELGELFETEMPDGSGGDKYPKGMRLVWSTNKQPVYGSFVLIRDRHRDLHAREYRQGPAPGQWIGAALHSAYRSIHSTEDGCRIVAVAKYAELP